jgi:hydrogenase maturation protein HypF
MLRQQICAGPPPRACIETVDVDEGTPAGLGPFAIAESAPGRPASARVSPDLATCGECLREVDDPRDRRYLYPFTNCTNCGPRYSIVRDVPYDRGRTTMAAFSMCGACASEYGDPLSRRFHAQPNACPACGPRLLVHPPHGGAPIDEAVAALRRSAIVAVKGIGGFHLACDARDPSAVRTLRTRKKRKDKPFAVMFPDIEAVAREASVSQAEREALEGPRRPIVLLKRREASALAPEVAPGLHEIGVLLPYTPIHHLLLRSFGGPLVMTSGNLSEEPIAATNEEALKCLSGIADLFLLHDREIHMRADDSVVRVLEDHERVLRRSRGHVPEAISLGFCAPDLLAVGADLKNALCLQSGGAALLSQHIGDLESYEAQRFFAEVRANLDTLFHVRPTLVAHDPHPGYHSTRLALGMGLPALAVQHHHAHIASCLADNDRRESVIGVAWDGTGYGADGTVWGGEILVADLGGFERVGRIRPVPMPGGDAAVREPWRMALSHLMAASLPTGRIESPGRRSVEAMIEEGIGTVPTSSAGRLFDAVASIAGLRQTTTYEGQAGCELEAASDEEGADRYPFPLSEVPGILELDPRPLLREIVSDLGRGVPTAVVGGGFHRALSAGIAEACLRVQALRGLHVVALSGGCFQNTLLTRLSEARLREAGFEVLLHRRVPPGDGGIALGQAAVAAWGARR